MAHVLYFLDGPEAGVVRRLGAAPGQVWRVSQLPADLQAGPHYTPSCPTALVTSVVEYALFKLPDGWPSHYRGDTEYVAKVRR